MQRLAITIVLACVATTAAADSKGEKLLQKAKKLHGEKKYAEACPTYEEVDKVDPSVAAKVNVAKCYEEWGRLATAYSWYEHAGKLAEPRDANKIKQSLDDLDVNVPRLTIKIPDGADPDVLETLTLDGKPVPEAWLNTQQRIDPGPHVLEFVVDGQRKKKMAPVERGGESELSLDIPKGEGKKVRKKKDETPAVETHDPGKTRRYIGLGLGGAGIVAVGVAVGMTVSARSDYKAALSAHCMGSTSGCDATGLRITHDARKTANIGTVITIVGAAAIAGGAVLYFTAPEATRSEAPVQALYVAPTVDTTGGGFVVGGAF